MATRKELLQSIAQLGGGLSTMQDRIMSAKSWEQDQADKKAQAEYLAKFRPLQLKTAEQGVTQGEQSIESGKLGLEGDRIKLEGSKKLAEAKAAMDSQIAGDWAFVDPADAPNVNAWKAKLAVINRSSDTPITPQEFYQAQKESRAKEIRAQESHTNQMANDSASRNASRYTGLGVSQEGNALLLDTRRGKVLDSGVGKQSIQKDGLFSDRVVKSGSVLIPDLEPIPDVQITKSSVEKTKDAMSKYSDFKTQLSEYIDLVDKGGAEVVGEAADQLSAYKVGLGMALKELQNLGVLNGKDWELMSKQIPDASGIGAKAKAIGYGVLGQNAFMPRLRTLDSFVENKFNSFIKANGFQRSQGGQDQAGDDAFNSVYGSKSSPAKSDSSFDFSRFKKQ